MEIKKITTLPETKWANILFSMLNEPLTNGHETWFLYQTHPKNKTDNLHSTRLNLSSTFIAALFAIKVITFMNTSC